MTTIMDWYPSEIRICKFHETFAGLGTFRVYCHVLLCHIFSILT